MSLLGAPVALFPAVSSLVGLIDPGLFNPHILREGRDVTLKEAVAAVGDVIRSGKASLPIDTLASATSKEDPSSKDPEKNLTEAFLKLKLPAELRQQNTLQEALNVAEVQAAMAGDAEQASATVTQGVGVGNNDAVPVNNNGGGNNRFDLGQWFRNQAQGVRNTLQQGQQQAQNFWLGGGLRRPFQNRNNLPENYFVRTPMAWRMMVPYGLLMNFLSWATPTDIPRFLPLADAAGYLGEVANPFMGVMFLGSMFLHLAEAGVAYALSRSYGLNAETSFAWFLQTLGFGMFSLQYLLFPDQRYMQRIDGPPDLSSYNLIDYLEGL